MKVKSRSTRKRVTTPEVPRNKPPSGPKFLNDEKFRAWLEKQIQENPELNNNSIGLKVGASRQTIANLRNETGTTNSPYVSKILLALGGELPVQSIPDAPSDAQTGEQLLQFVVDRWPELDERGRRAVASTIDAILAARSVKR